MAETLQRWHLRLDGREHRVESSGSARHRVRWYVDDVLVGESTGMEEKQEVKPRKDLDELDGDLVGTVLVRFGTLGAPQRATYRAGTGEELGDLAGLGGVDLEPEEGSRAAAYEERLRENPTRYALIQGAGGVAKVVVPIVLVWLAARFAFQLPWPDWSLPTIDLPSVPWPDWSLPTPDLPSIPWPDWSLPGWVLWLLDNAKYVVPVLVALALARAEIRRRRTQDEQREARRRALEAGAEERED